ncbi:MAG: LpxI family protein, partial [Rhodobacteraceae bacterium]|nr:LpxI family protein [Paracoccaceae bacterium]
MSALALIAGRGRLPDEVASALAARGGEVLVAALEGNSPDRLRPDLVFRIETLGSFLNALRAKGVREICMAG